MPRPAVPSRTATSPPRPATPATPARGIFTLSARSTGMALDVLGWSVAPGTPVIAWPHTGAPNQEWEIVPLPSGNVHRQPAADAAAARRR
jgi:hypothetical protein